MAAKRSSKTKYLQEQKRQERKQQSRQDRKKKLWKRGIIIGGAVLGTVGVTAGIIGGIHWYRNSGRMLRSKIAASSASYQLNGMTFTYCFESSREQYYENYSSYLDDYGLDRSKPLREQSYGTDTWFDFFLDAAVSSVETMLAVCEEARADGVSLTDEQNARIDNELSALDLGKYPSGMKKEDVRTAMECMQLATGYYSILAEKLAASEEDLNRYYEEHTEDFLKWEAKCYYFSYVEDESEEGLTQTEAGYYAEQLAQCTTEEEFDECIAAYLRMSNPDLTDDEIAETLEQLTGTSSYQSSGEDMYNWAISSEPGATYSAQSESNCMYIVYMLLSKPERDMTPTKDVRHILIMLDNYDTQEEAKAKADAVWTEFLTTDKSEESFAELAELRSEDPGSNENGGLYENVQEGEMVENFNDWCFDPERKPGDYELIETEFGYHLMYFSGEGQVAWQGTAETALFQERYQSWYDEAVERYQIRIDEEICSQIPVS